MNNRHFRRVTKLVTSDSELKELEAFISIKGGIIIGAEQARNGKGTLVYYTL